MKTLAATKGTARLGGAIAMSSAPGPNVSADPTIVGPTPKRLATRLEALARQAERALLIPVGVALEARDRVIETAQTYSTPTKAKRRFDRFERRGATALRRNRRTLEREARELRREVEARADQASSEAGKRVRSLAS